MDAEPRHEVEGRLRALLAAGNVSAVSAWVDELSYDDVARAQQVLEEVVASGSAGDAGTALPLALELAVSTDDLVELSTVVAARPERALRRALLEQLVPARLGQRFEDRELLRALDALAADEADPGLRAAIDKARGVPSPAVADSTGHGARGLWDLTPVAVPGLTDRPYGYGSLTHRWTSHVSTRPGPPDERLTDKVLTALAEGDLGPRDLVTVSHELLATGHLSLDRATGHFEALFLGGAMSLAWPVAMSTAEACVSRSRTGPGLPAFLRMLGRHARETPGPVDLPPHLAQLAADGRSDAAREAHELGARLGRVRPEDYDPGPAAGAAPRPDDLGLWVERSEPDPQKLSFPVRRNLETVSRRLAQVRHGEGLPRAMTRAQIRLEEVVALTREHGPDPVRSALADFSSPERGNTMHGMVQAWAAGVVTPEIYWRVAAHGISTREVSELWSKKMSYAEGSERFRRETPASLLAHDPPVIGSWMASSVETSVRLEALHTLEVLLVGEASGSMVSAPCRSDGTLCVDGLLSRLAEATCVGPIDVLVALHRLRGARPSDAPRVVGEVPTAPAVTSPGGSVTRSASGTVREWLAGGLVVAVTHDTSAEVQIAPPVPWTTCEAVSARQGLADALTSGAPRTFVPYLLPGRPMLELTDGFLSQGRGSSIADVGGALDVEVWDQLLVALGWVGDRQQSEVLKTEQLNILVRLYAQGRLDAEVAVDACVARWERQGPAVFGDARGWDQAFLRGAMAGLWPVALGIVAAGLSRPERPDDLTGLVEVLTRRVHEVPHRVVPSSVLGVAAEDADTPLHRAVRSFVEAASQTRRSRGSPP